jgi:hypothetical protein
MASPTNSSVTTEQASVLSQVCAYAIEQKECEGEGEKKEKKKREKEDVMMSKGTIHRLLYFYREGESDN